MRRDFSSTSTDAASIPEGHEALSREVAELRRLQAILFDDAPVPMMLEDWSGIKAMVRELKRAGVTDWEAYFAAHPEFFTKAQEHLVYLDANKATVAMFGAKDKESFFRVLKDVLPKAPTSDSAIVRAMVRGDRVARGERRIKTPDGRKLAILWQVDVDLESTAPMLFLAIDITERLDTEEALSRAQDELTHSMRAAVLGEMAASIAHEVNQPLAATSLYAESALRWIERDVPDLERARASIRRIVRSSGHAADVVRKVKGFVRKEVPEYGDLDVRDVLADAELIVQREAHDRRIELRFELQGGLPRVKGVKVQVQQVLVNLIVNSVHALADEDKPYKWVSVLVRSGGAGKVNFEVRDNGPGIPSSHADRIFEPFFSTKPEGLGLGLSICRRVVEAHGGALRAVNHESGASFIFELEAASTSVRPSP